MLWSAVVQKVNVVAWLITRGGEVFKVSINYIWSDWWILYITLKTKWTFSFILTYLNSIKYQHLLCKVTALSQYQAFEWELGSSQYITGESRVSDRAKILKCIVMW